MCKPTADKKLFYAKGEAKGWDKERIDRAWAAHKAWLDAEAIRQAPAPEIKVGDRVIKKAGVGFEYTVLAIHERHAWLKDQDRETYGFNTIRLDELQHIEEAS